MFSNKFIVIHFESMVAGNTKAVGNWFMKENSAFIPPAQYTLNCHRIVHKTHRIVTKKRNENTKENYYHYSRVTIYSLVLLKVNQKNG